jgi:hypothetical protein
MSLRILSSDIVGGISLAQSSIPLCLTLAAGSVPRLSRVVVGLSRAAFLLDSLRRERLPMKKLTLLAVAVPLVVCGVGRGGTERFNFTFVDSFDGITASGTLIATNNGGGQFTATSVVNGSITGNPGGDGALTLVPNPNAPGGIGSLGTLTYDNFLFPSQFQTLDVNGLLFSVPNGSLVNIWANLPVTIGAQYELADADSFGNGSFLSAVTPDFTLTPATPVPEPSTLCLPFLGAAAFAACRKRKRV